ncbi:NAD-dependent epimerase/dehydratase [Citrobacter werkmanii]|nr:NAD-dependent epimerase/dehydratase [Citrobacter werkmanii]MBJ9874073.1 NAD-dependent epimerase/dehydratase [Citrobacter werkmanii]HEB0855341.1 NAD-dependent epimerase/dehydratase [Citrobacter freundii]
MKILVMGAFGYLGSQLMSYFESQHSVVGLARKKKSGDYRKNIIYTTDSEWVEKIIKFKPDIVVNTAACYGRNNESASVLLESNILLPIKVIESITSFNSVFINCGTSLPQDVNLYAYTKQKLPEIARVIINKTDNKFLELKLEHFFGAFDGDGKFTSMVIRSCLNNKAIKLTSGSQKRDFIYIKDLLSAFDCILNHIHEFPKFHTIEVGSGEAVSIREYVDTVQRITKSCSEIEFGAVEQRENELMYSCANVTELKKIGWQREYSLVNAISEIVEKEK